MSRYIVVTTAVCLCALLTWGAWAQLAEEEVRETPTPDAKPTATPTPALDDEASTWTLAGLFAGGDGSEKDPFIVKSKEQLGYAMHYRGERFVMVNADGSMTRLDFAPPVDAKDVEVRLLKKTDLEKASIETATDADGELIAAVKASAETFDSAVTAEPTTRELVDKCPVYLSAFTAEVAK